MKVIFPLMSYLSSSGKKAQKKKFRPVWDFYFVLFLFFFFFFSGLTAKIAFIFMSLSTAFHLCLIGIFYFYLQPSGDFCPWSYGETLWVRLFLLLLGGKYMTFVYSQPFKTNKAGKVDKYTKNTRNKLLFTYRTIGNI